MYKLTRLLLILALVLGLYTVAVFTAIYWPLSGFVLAAIIVLYLRKRKGRPLTVLGSARFAEKPDLRRAGMIDANSGLILGHLIASECSRRTAAVLGLWSSQLNAKQACSDFFAMGTRERGVLVRLPQSIHTAIFSPSGGGKGVSIVIPFLLQSAESCVVLDPKGENARLTAEHRKRKFGHRIVLLDPYNVVTQTPDSLNPLAFIQKDDPEAIDECNDLAKALVIRNPDEREPHWSDSAEMWIAALLGVVALFGDTTEGTRSLQTVRDILSSPQKLDLAIKLMLESTVGGGMLARMGGQLTHYIDKEKSSTLTTVSRNLRFLDSLAVAQSTRTSSFDPAALRSGKLTIYLILPPNRMKAQSALLRMWIVSLMRAVVNGGLQERNKVHFILDEAACLGHLEAIDDAIDKYRAYGLRMIFIYQSLGQLKRCFPDGQEQTLLSNTSQIFFGVNDQGLPGGAGTADYVSARLGEKTVVVASGGTGTGTTAQWSSGSGQQSSGGSRSKNSNDNWGLQARKLCKPEEVVALDPRIAITFTPGVPPVCTSLVRYYEDSNLGVAPGIVRGGFTACGNLAISALWCGLAIAMAVRVTQRAPELWKEEHAASPPPPSQPVYFRDEQSGVPVD